MAEFPCRFHPFIGCLPKEHSCIFGSAAVWAWFNQHASAPGWEPLDLDVVLHYATPTEFRNAVDAIVDNIKGIAFWTRIYNTQISSWNERVTIKCTVSEYPVKVVSLDLVYSMEVPEKFVSHMNASFNQIGWLLNTNEWIGGTPTPPDVVAVLRYVPILEDVGAFVTKYTERGWTSWLLQPAGEDRELFLMSTYVPDLERKWRYFRKQNRYPEKFLVADEVSRGHDEVSRDSDESGPTPVVMFHDRADSDESGPTPVGMFHADDEGVLLKRRRS